MRRTILLLSAFAIGAAAGHLLLLDRLPSMIMAKAMTRMEESGVPLHRFTFAPRVTPWTQSVVRPSPDLAYSVCRFDVTAGPVLVGGAVWPEYGSLSIYDADTDNVAALSLDSRTDGPRAILVALDGAALPDGAGQHPVVRLSRPQGLALIRRLAPGDARHRAARALAAGDVCAPLPK